MPVPDGVELDKVDACFNPDCDATENSGSAEGGKEDHGESWLTLLSRRRYFCNDVFC